MRDHLRQTVPDRTSVCRSSQQVPQLMPRRLGPCINIQRHHVHSLIVQTVSFRTPRYNEKIIMRTLSSHADQEWRRILTTPSSSFRYELKKWQVVNGPHDTPPALFIPQALETLKAEPWFSSIAWPNLFEYWTIDLAHASPYDAIQACQCMVEKLSLFPPPIRKALAHQAYHAVQHTLGFHGYTPNDAEYFSVYTSMGLLGSLTSFEPLKTEWLKTCPYGTQALAYAVGHANLPSSWCLDWFGHYADAQAWTTNADVLEPLLLQTYPSAIERFNHIPWVIEQSDTNKVLMAAYFPMEYAILSLLAPEETWRGFPLSPAREFDDLRSMFKHVTLGHHEPLPLPLPTCEPLD